MVTEDQDEMEQSTETRKSLHWLQRLKEESWEAELLVSAIAIYGTFQLFKVINLATNFFIDKLPPNQYLIAYFIVFMGLIAISILTSMFVIHFFLRAYWVGLVGLNSVFPDYGLNDSAYSKIYTQKMLNNLPKLEDSIKRVDSLCSVIFSAAFTILIIYAYLAVILSIYLVIYNLLIDYIPSYILIIPPLIIGILIIFQSIFGFIANLKKYKENEKFQDLYFNLVKTTSLITLGPLYKNIMQVMMTFASNYKSNKSIVGLLMFFFLSGIMLSIFQINQTNIYYLVRTDFYFDDLKPYAGYYHSENKDMDFLLSPEINSDLIETNVLKLFIPIFSNEQKKQDAFCGPIEKDKSLLREDQLRKLRTEKIDCYAKYNLVSLNDEPVETEYLRYVHPKTNQFGLVCFIKLPSALAGKNRLRVKKIFDDEVFSDWSIPFYYLLKEEGRRE